LSEPTVTFSVIVPTGNRLPVLKLNLDSLFAQEYSGYEIIVVNDGSRDGTREYLEEIRREKGFRVIELADKGVATARNAGAKAAQGRLLAFLDDDCSVSPTWLTDLTSALDRHGASLVFGNVRNDLVDSDCSVVHHEMNQFLIGRLNADRYHPRFVLTSSFACEVEVFHECGGFDERFYFGSEDRELIGRMIATGRRVAYDESIVVGHRHHFTARLFFRYYYKLGRSSHLLFNVANSEKKLGMTSNPVRTILVMLGTIGAREGLFRRMRLVVLALAAQAIMFFGYLGARMAGKTDLRSAAVAAGGTSS